MTTLKLSPPENRGLRIDWIVVGVVLALSLLGIVTIWGAAASDGTPGPFAGYARRQFQWMLVGIALAAGLTVADYRWTRAAVWPAYVLLLLVLLYLLSLDQRIKGAASWFVIQLGSYRFSAQPSELGKVIVVLALSAYLAPRVLTFRKFWHTFVPLLILALPVGLVLLQPDFGTAVVYFPAAFALFLVAGIRKRVIVMYAVLAVLAGAAAYPQLKPYQKDRIAVFLNPGEDALGKGYNIIQAQTALGSGRMFGKGWGRGTQTSFRFLPEYQTDFVFPTLGEQFGFVGCAGALLLYGILLGRLLYIAGRTEDLYGTLIVVGVTAILFVHLVLNVGMATGMLPVTGLPLPFLSYGGSFILSCYIMIGLALSVAARS
jgi:rod shape determining protein RodA